MAKKPASPPWPFARKFALYLKDNGLTLAGFAAKHGLKQRNLHNWVKAGVRIPADAVCQIALATGLSIDYWMNPNTPYPAVTAEKATVAEFVQRAESLTPAQFRDVFEMLGAQADVDRTLALRRAARGR